MRTRFAVLVAPLLAALALASACSSSATGTTTSQDAITAIGAENEYASVIQQVGGKYVRVSAIMNNPSTDPHTFEASPAVAREISNASLMVVNGLGYDTWATDIEKAVPSDGRKVINVQQLLGLPDSTPNPHLWYSPATMPKVATAIASDLAAIQPAHAGYFKANAAAFAKSLTAWTRAIAGFRAAHPHTPVATTEPVADYMLQAAGADNMTPWAFQADIMNGTDPSPQNAAAERALFTQHKVKVFLYSQQVTSTLTQSYIKLAHDNGIPVVGVYETMPTPGYDYQTWMTAEVNALDKAVTAKVSTEHL